jgi:catechol 2,3-dioxygenase-like lactoylglutathione lyase family enzyme
MLSSSNVVAVAAVADIAKAKGFYEGTLGLHPLEIDEPGGVLYACAGGSQLLVYESRFAGTNQATAASWQVEDIDQEVADLAGRGVSFEHYELPGATLEGDVHVLGELRAAWFKDPDGNILNIVSRGAGGG